MRAMMILTLMLVPGQLLAQVSLDWDAVTLDIQNTPETIDHYEVGWGASSGHYTSTQATVDAQNSLALTGLTEGQRYYFAVRAIDASGNVSDWSSEEDCSYQGGVVSCCQTGDSRQCSTDEGECVMGQQTCTDGAWRDCSPETVYASVEICDQLDNDCDGQTDEGDVCGSEPPVESIGGGCSMASKGASPGFLAFWGLLLLLRRKARGAEVRAKRWP
jgi:chitodextrinase